MYLYTGTVYAIPATTKTQRIKKHSTAKVICDDDDDDNTHTHSKAQSRAHKSKNMGAREKKK